MTISSSEQLEESKKYARLDDVIADDLGIPKTRVATKIDPTIIDSMQHFETRLEATRRSIREKEKKLWLKREDEKNGYVGRRSTLAEN